jgi:hypothetical protein
LLCEIDAAEVFARAAPVFSKCEIALFRQMDAALWKDCGKKSDRGSFDAAVD